MANLCYTFIFVSLSLKPLSCSCYESPWNGVTKSEVSEYTCFWHELQIQHRSIKDAFKQRITVHFEYDTWDEKRLVEMSTQYKRENHLFNYSCSNDMRRRRNLKMHGSATRKNAYISSFVYIGLNNLFLLQLFRFFITVKF